MSIKFFYNGMKGEDGKLQKCRYHDGELYNHPAGTITIYAREYARFSAEIAEAFAIENNTDTQTDYFEKDHIRVRPDHPLYSQVKAALDKLNARYA